MDATSIRTIADWCRGQLLSGSEKALVTRIATDSRILTAGDLFIALKGENFDGHKFIDDALARGAMGVILEKGDQKFSPDLVVVRVDSSLHALQEISAGYRRSLGGKVIGVTGSSGKTSTKDMIAAILGLKLQVSATRGNLNNQIGLPISLLGMRSEDHVGVFEIGMNQPGEIAVLAKIAKPDIGLITNVGVAHIGNFGSRDAIAAEKAAMASALTPDGTLFLNFNDDYTSFISKETKANVVRCGLHPDAEIGASNLRWDGKAMHFRLHIGGRSIEAQLPVPGAHMVQNATLAVGVASLFGVSLKDCAIGLQHLKLTGGRLELKVLRGVEIIDDSYNANPDSVRAALAAFSQIQVAGRRIAVLGQMAELGGTAEEGHRSVGRAAIRTGLDCLITVGGDAVYIGEEAKLSGEIEIFHVVDSGEAAQLLLEIARVGDAVLVKGSRSAKMERVLEKFAAL